MDIEEEFEIGTPQNTPESRSSSETEPLGSIDLVKPMDPSRNVNLAKRRMLSNIPKRICVSQRSLTSLGYKDYEDWDTNPYHRYIGHTNYYISKKRAWDWANPYTTQTYSRDTVMEKYEEYIRSNLYDELDEFYGLTQIGCWCDPSDKCHGDVIIKLLKEKINNL